MKDIDTLISELTSQAVVAPQPMTLTRVVSSWIIGIVLYISAIFLSGLYTLRPDLITLLSNPMFVMEVGVLVLLVLSTTIAAAVLSFPDLYQKPTLTDIPLALFVIFAFILEAEWVQDAASSSFSFEGVRCLACITGLSLVPAFGILYKMKHLATTNPEKACALAVLCSFSVGALILRLSEPNDVISHIVIWHYAPMFLVGLLGLWIGPKLLKW